MNTDRISTDLYRQSISAARHEKKPPVGVMQMADRPHRAVLSVEKTSPPQGRSADFWRAIGEEATLSTPQIGFAFGIEAVTSRAIARAWRILLMDSKSYKE